MDSSRWDCVLAWFLLLPQFLHELARAGIWGNVDCKKHAKTWNKLNDSSRWDCVLAWFLLLPQCLHELARAGIWGNVDCKNHAKTWNKLKKSSTNKRLKPAKHVYPLKALDFLKLSHILHNACYVKLFLLLFFLDLKKLWLQKATKSQNFLPT